MIIVGVGIAPMQLTEEAATVIKRARHVYGSKRAIELVKHHIHGEAHLLKDYTKIQQLPQDAVVLSTGDPMLSGLGKYKKPTDIVIPGISSMQVACARLGIEEDTLEVITVHGRDASLAENRIINALQQGKTLFLLPDPKSFGPKELSKLLNKHQMKATMAVCEKLAYPEERIRITDTQHPPEVSTSLYCMVVWR
jgi:cobalt-precorrin-7 (C5)-methyltransferase